MQSEVVPYFPEDVSAKRCGCYIRRPDLLGLKFNKALVPLKHIDYHLEVVNSLVNFTLKQKYENPTDKYLEVDYSLPISPESSVYKFEAEFGNVKIEGIVKQKQQAKKEFEQAKSQGKQAVLGTIDPNSKDILNLEIGNIPPKSQFTVTISFLQEMGISLNTFYRIQVPSTISPRFMNFVEQRQKELKKQKQPKPVEGKAQFDWTFKIDLITTRKVIFFDSPSHNITLLNQNEKGTETLLVMANAEVPNKDFTFVYTTEDFHLPGYVLGNTDTSSTVMLSFIPKFCTLDVNDAYKASIANKSYDTDMSTAKGDYIFFLDRSGSMQGTRIEKAKEALILFLKSLPEDSYFNVISFGSGNMRMFPTSVKNDSAKIKQSIDKIKKMSADMGGTEIYQILSVVLQQKVQEGYPRHLFLLTDGGVSNTQGVIQMVKKNTKYARVHCIGIGNGASFDLIQGCAESGKGKFVMISDQENPAEKIIELLETTLTPIISKVSLKCSNENDIDSIVPNPKSIPYILKDDVINFYMTFKGPFTEKKQFVFEYEDSVTKLPYKATMEVEPSTLNQPFVDKMAHLKVLRSLQSSAKDGINIEDQMYYVKVKDFKQEAIKYSVQHQVLSEYTAFLCVGKELVDGQYQQYKATGLQHVQVEQPKPIQYQLQQCNQPLGFCPPSSSLSSSSYAPRKKMAMAPMARMAPQRNNMAMCAPMAMKAKKKSSGLGIVAGLSSFGSSIASSVSGLFSKPQLSNPQPQKQTLRASRQAQKMKISYDQEDDIKRQIQSLKVEQNCLRSQKLGDLMMEECVFDQLVQRKQKQKEKREREEGNKREDKKEKSQEISNKDSKKMYKVQDIIQMQAADGSWDDIKLIDKLASKPKQVTELTKQINQLIVVTKLVILWMQKYHPEKQYALIIKKAISWLNKAVKENAVDEAALTTIEVV